MKIEKQIEKQTDEKDNAVKNDASDVNHIKIGTIQLQTKSFWISIVAVLCLFLFASYYMNYRLTKNIMQHNEEVLKIILNHFKTNKE